MAGLLALSEIDPREKSVDGHGGSYAMITAKRTQVWPNDLRPAPRHRQEASPETAPVVLVAGPNIPPEVVMRHCGSALSAGRRLELLQLGDMTLIQRRHLSELEKRYGDGSVRMVETHSDWLALPPERTLIIISDNGLWCGDDRILDHPEMLSMSQAALSRLYMSRPLPERSRSGA
ncbi:hypothetical protein [Leifsonia sp. EB34]|uniref:hypothetical protein n=1 Tax=Leifsonia sp. EB34 TaxID=3156303 RepID=UPI0035116DAD